MTRSVALADLAWTIVTDAAYAHSTCHPDAAGPTGLRTVTLAGGPGGSSTYANAFDYRLAIEPRPLMSILGDLGTWRSKIANSNGLRARASRMRQTILGPSRLRAAAAGFSDLGGTGDVGLEFGHFAEAFGEAFKQLSVECRLSGSKGIVAP